ATARKEGWSLAEHTRGVDGVALRGGAEHVCWGVPFSSCMAATFAPQAIRDLKQRACSRIDELEPRLGDVSRRIWQTPETLFQERQASGWLSDLLRDSGYAVELGVGGLATAFTGTHANGSGPTIGLFCEYDALPEIGHGCGHNLLAISGVGAGLGLAA